MTTCLETLDATLQQIAASLAAGQDISISLQANADANADSASAAFSQSISVAVAYAEAVAVALAFVDVDVRVEQTSIVNLILPPVDEFRPPNLTDYPSAETGVTDTPVSQSGETSDACQLLYQYLNAVVTLATKFALITQPLYAIASWLYWYLELQMKFLVGVGLQIPLPKQVAAALVGAMVAASQISPNPANDLNTALADLSSGGFVSLRCELWNALENGMDSFIMAEVAQAWVDSRNWPIAATVFFKTLFGPSVWAAVWYEPIWGVPNTNFNCDAGCGV